MERRFELRKEALVAEAQVDEKAFRGAVEGLQKFVEPFAACLRDASRCSTRRTSWQAWFPIWTARIPSRSPIVTIKNVRNCNTSSANRTGITSR